MIMTWNVFSNIRFNFDFIEALFYNSKNKCGFYVVKKETRKEDFVHF